MKPTCKVCGGPIQPHNLSGICSKERKCQAVRKQVANAKTLKPPDSKRFLPDGFAAARVKITPRGDGNEYELAVYDGNDYSPVVVSRNLAAIEAAASTIRACLRDCVLCDRGWHSSHR